MRKVMIASLLLGLGSVAEAQNEADVYRFSYRQLNGTPRSMAMGGAMNALGADLSALSYNPAGLAQFRSNQAMMSLNYVQGTTNSSYLSNQSSIPFSALTIPNLGMSFTQINMDKGKEVKDGVVSFTLAFNMNREQGFNYKHQINGLNLSSSRLDAFAQMAEGRTEQELFADDYSAAGLAYNTYAIDPSQAGPTSYVAALPDSIGLWQSGNLDANGRKNNFNLGLGLNLSNTLYLGFAVRMSRVRYEHREVWKEEGYDPNTNGTKRYTYNMNLQTSGTSGGVSGGFIFVPNEYLRAGISFHSRDVYFMRDEYSSGMETYGFFGAGETTELNGNLYDYSYRITVPGRLDAGVSIIWPKTAVFSFDLEYLDYGNGRLADDANSFEFNNRNISQRFRSVYNYRAGTEFLIGPHRVRGGYAYFANPLADGFRADQRLARNNYSLGYGFRDATGFFLDVTFVYQSENTLYTPYTLFNSDREYYTAENTINRYNFMVAIGTSF